jgi:hypothetical protein
LVPGKPRIEEEQLKGTDYGLGEPLALNNLIIEAESRRIVLLDKGEKVSLNRPEQIFWSGMCPVWAPSGRYLAYWNALPGF